MRAWKQTMMGPEKQQAWVSPALFWALSNHYFGFFLQPTDFHLCMLCFYKLLVWTLVFVFWNPLGALFQENKLMGKFIELIGKGQINTIDNPMISSYLHT